MRHFAPLKEGPLGFGRGQRLTGWVQHEFGVRADAIRWQETEAAVETAAAYLVVDWREDVEGV